MWHWQRFASDFETLEMAAERAGTALACSFASSAEFGAATIEAKRAVGIYGPKRGRRQALSIVVAVAVAALLFSELL